MVEKVSVASVYKEVEAIRRMLEDLSERGILASLDSEPITEAERKKLDQACEEVRRGKSVSLSKIKRS